MKSTLIALSLALIFILAASAPEASAQTSPPNSGIVFKIPDGVLPMDWNKSGFRGFLMLKKDGPAGVFIAYPNDGETLADLRERIAKFISPMFARGEVEKGTVDFRKSPIPVHQGDVENSGLYYAYENEKGMTQILFYEREANGKRVVYGYFANKAKNAKPKDVKDIWADEKGEGVKLFDKFWKTFKN